jgi:predicted AAA+ superfamily ATPase
MLHLILVGPKKSGKTHIAETIKNTYKKYVINFDEIVSWHINNGT